VARWRQGDYALATSPALLAEMSAVLTRPHLTDLIPSQDVQGLTRLINRRGIIVPGVVQVRAVQDDPDDDAVLACAVEAGADYVVSGDRHLLSLGSYEGIPIVRAAEFLALLDAQASAPG